MANFDTNLFRKKNKQRGVYGGKEQSVTGVLRIEDGGSIATTDLIRAVPMGENTRPIRIVLTATPVSGTPVLTNPTFDVGVTPHQATTFTRPDGTEYDPLSADADILVDAMVIDAANMEASTAVNRPVADSVSNYGPYTVTLTPSGVGAFSVAGGAIDLGVTVVFLGEQKSDGFVYEEYMPTNVNNQT